MNSVRLQHLILLLLPVAVAGCTLFGDPVSQPRPSFDVHEPALSQLPERLGLSTARVRLPGAAVNTRGTIRAAVFPVAVGRRMPVWTDSAIAFELVGTHRPPNERGAAGYLANESQGLFRLEASVFPAVVDVNTPPGAMNSELVNSTAVVGFVENVLRRWGRQVNLAAYDNDGPDGHPMSGDDDGVMDLPIIVVETDSTPAIAHVPTNLTIPVGKNGRFSLDVGVVHVVTVPRSGRLGSGHLGLTTALLGALGLNSDEMYLPATVSSETSTLARVRLGWMAASWAASSGRYSLSPDRALAVPVVDVDGNRGQWLIEWRRQHVYLTRVARKSDGHFATVEFIRFAQGDPVRTLPLTRTEGEFGPRFSVAWPEEGRPVVHVDLTPDDS